MKKIAIGVFSIIFILLIILIAFTVHGRSIRQTEFENALTSSMEKAFSILEAESSVAPANNEEFIADFMQAFLLQIDSSSDIAIHILDADYEKGLLSVEAIGTYTHPIGTKGTISVSKIMIKEFYEEHEEKEYFTLQYMLDGKIHKQYTLLEGTLAMLPADPNVTGKTFVGWSDIETNELISIEGSLVTQNRIFVAVFQ